MKLSRSVCVGGLSVVPGDSLVTIGVDVAFYPFGLAPSTQALSIYLSEYTALLLFCTVVELG